MSQDKKRVLVTSALPYINGVKHLGNLAGSMLPADVYARFMRQRLGADNVLFICATDEHGTPAELAAIAEGKSVREYCDYWWTEQKRIYEGFALSFDHFGRSSSEQNRKLTQEFARTLWNNGYLYVKATKQVYSRADKRFLPDRYVVGTCPHCGYERATGDQCENCTRVLDPADLKNPRSALSGSPDIEIRETKHLFLKQTAFEKKLREWIGGKKDEWPPLVTGIALKWLEEGLQDRGITRDLEWGVPVDTTGWNGLSDADREGLKGKVFYVWFDAPIEYIGATWEWASEKKGRDWQSWWKGDAARDVTYVQFMGKDNVPFHTVGFPCTLMGANEKLPANGRWKLVDELKGFNWLNYYGGKFSTSQKRGVFMDAALELLPADYWRWYLIANAPESADSSFTWQHFAATVNKDLADVLGNFVNRVLKFAAARFDRRVPGTNYELAPGNLSPEENKLVIDLTAHITSYAKELAGLWFRPAAIELRKIWVLSNEFVTQAAPWTFIKTDNARAAQAIRVSINLIRLLAEISQPVIPEFTARISKALRISCEPIVMTHIQASGGSQKHEASLSSEHIYNALNAIRPAQSFDVPDVLFKKIEDSQIAEWESRFGGGA